MSEVNLNIGSEVFNGNARYHIVNIIDLEHVLARSAATGATKKFNISELTSSPADSTDPVEIIASDSLMEIKDDDWLKLQNKAALFSEVLQIKGNASLRRQKLQEVADKLNLSESSAYRLLKRFQDDSLNLTTFLRKQRKDTPRLEDQTERFVQEAIKEYLNIKQPKVTDVYRDMKYKIMALNKQNRENGIDEVIECPHINTLRNRIKKIPTSAIATQRLGKKGREQFRPIKGKFPKTLKPLQIVQLDHTPLDVIVVDDENRMEIGRPTVTLAIDSFSRVVVGFFITLEKPSALLAGCCLTHAILDKKSWMLEHEVPGDYPVFGIPDVVHTDQGAEFFSKAFLRACESRNITVMKRPAGTPRYGPYIERAFKSFNSGGIHSLPGTTKSKHEDRGEYKSEQHAAMTLKELETWFTEFIVNVYHQEVHSEIGMPPIAKYEMGILGNDKLPGRGLPPKIDDPMRLKIEFLPYEEKTVQKYGIKMKGITYKHDVLRKWIKQQDNTTKATRKFYVHYDPRDMSKVFFYDPDMNSYIAIPYNNTSHPAISLWELKALKKKAAEFNPHEPVDEDAIFEARMRMKYIVEKAQKDTKHARLQRQKEVVRKQDSIPSQANRLLKTPQPNSVFNPSIDTPNDDEFDDLQPFKASE
ncbi:Mu transposase C-terminal domain-containing protein [Thiomicrorhabdus cannonii]|uniref:Mu transposase C-terminal domain-containing protein n=1 Tax=Thiomicrorhabdus cannonii TaxID=2748011 RepID=UPI0015BC60D2|nr:Mu transposase C-terminal domain-containing protein [Thiomicrorhabdus cannonii]